MPAQSRLDSANKIVSIFLKENPSQNGSPALEPTLSRNLSKKTDEIRSMLSKTTHEYTSPGETKNALKINDPALIERVLNDVAAFKTAKSDGKIVMTTVSAPSKHDY